MVFVLLLGALGSVFIQKRVFVQWGFTYHFIVAVPFLVLGVTWALQQSFPRRGAAQLTGGRVPGGGGVPPGPDLELQPPLGLPERVV